MSNNNKPTVVVGCGAHHIQYHYRFLEDALQNAGYAVRVVQLPSTSAEVVEDAMSKDVEAIREAVEGEVKAGKDVIMVLHSWSGFVGSAAVEGLEKNVRHIVFLASWIQPSGKGSCEWLGVEELPIYDVKNGLNYVKEPITKFYHDLPSDVASDSVKYLLPMVNSVTKDPLRIPPVWEKIPCTYVICDEDDAVPPFFAEMMIRDSRVEAEVVRMGGGHSPFLGERVGTLAQIVKKAAGEEIGSIEGVRVDEKKLF